MTKKTKKYLVLAFVLIVFLGIISIIKLKMPEKRAPSAETQNAGIEASGSEETLKEAGNSAETKTPADIEPEQKITAPAIASNFSLNVPFVTQAPYTNWDALHEDACEEASIVMIDHYYSKKSLDKDIGEAEIQKLIQYEADSGFGLSISLYDLARISQNYFNRTMEVKQFGIDAIKRDIASGKPVIIPAAGKLLSNPNFKNGGPNYHMLVLKGYTDSGFVTNDPGTRRGDGYFYDYATISNAVHDWNSTDITKGEKLYLVSK